MAHSDHGIVKDKRAEDQPRDKQRAQAVHKTDSLAELVWLYQILHKFDLIDADFQKKLGEPR